MKPTMDHNQDKVFLETEGDSYYTRNQLALEQPNQFFCEDLICQALSSSKSEIHRILEIGCSSGMKLQYLCRFFAASGCGIDPSSKAVAAGNARLSQDGIQGVTLTVSTADVLPFEDSEFDLVYFAFCLYLVDRASLFAAVAEADRVLKTGGFLAIVDFDPSQRQMRPYHHRPGVFSYKQQYADLFTASGLYHLVAKHSFSHHDHSFAKDSDERVSLCLLYKDPQAYPLNAPPRVP